MSRQLSTSLIHARQAAAPTYEASQPGVFRASTLYFADSAEWRAWKAAPHARPAYGTSGTPTTMALEQRIAGVEGASHAVLCPSGMSAIALVYQVALLPGDELLVPVNVYPSNRQFVLHELMRRGVLVRTYDPTDLATLEFSEHTRLVWAEIPAALTFEMPDLPALCARAHAHGALVALDTTWSAGVACAGFDFDIDFAVQSLSKFAAGTSEVIMGAVATKDAVLDEALRIGRRRHGLNVSPMDAATVIAGLQTLPLRYRTQDASARHLCAFLAGQPEIAQVLHPALESCPGHEYWRRDCRAAAGLLSVVLRPDIHAAWCDRFIDGLQLFRIGFGWGGSTSLVMPYDVDEVARLDDTPGQLLRLAIGLEEVGDLQADLAGAFAAARGA